MCIQGTINAFVFESPKTKLFLKKEFEVVRYVNGELHNLLLRRQRMRISQKLFYIFLPKSCVATSVLSTRFLYAVVFSEFEIAKHCVFTEKKKVFFIEKAKCCCKTALHQVSRIKSIVKA